MTKPELGDRVRDRVNGFEGMVTGRAEYLYGSTQILVTPTEAPTEGKPPLNVWLDEDRVEMVSEGDVTRS